MALPATHNASKSEIIHEVNLPENLCFLIFYTGSQEIVSCFLHSYGPFFSILPEQQQFCNKKETGILSP